MWTNQEVTHTYNPLVLVTNDTARVGFNVSGTACPGWALALQATGPATSAESGGRYQPRRER
jgi:hypothetical protein